jgi:chaperone BCS1
MWQTAWTFLSNQVSSNQFLSGGAVLAVLGILAAYFRTIPSIINQWVQARIIIELDIPDRDDSFEWLDYWLSQQKYQKKCRLLTISTGKKKKRRHDQSVTPQEPTASTDKPDICLSPAPGLHYFFYKRRLIILRRERKDSQVSNGSSSVGFRETFTLRCLTRKRQIITDLLTEARETLHPPEDSRVSVFVPSYGDWTRSAKKMPRALNSVILPEGDSQKMLSQITQFQQSEAWYAGLGIPYRMGVLLYGPPGNGKSSLVMAVASELNLDVCVLNLSTSGMTDEKIIEQFTNLPEKAILLIEDIDCIFHSREKKEGAECITFSGLLNAIDGVLAGDNRILFLTTNHKEKLDPALIRPGRCDVHMLIDNATPTQAHELFNRFFPDREDLAMQFELLTSGVIVSMAEIQGHLLKNRESPEIALTSWETIVYCKKRECECTTTKTT